MFSVNFSLLVFTLSANDILFKKYFKPYYIHIFKFCSQCQVVMLQHFKRKWPTCNIVSLIETKSSDTKLKIPNLFPCYPFSSQVALQKLFLHEKSMQIFNTDKTWIQTFLRTFSDAQLKPERIQVSGLCIFCISLLFLQPKISLNLLVNFTQILHLVERSERYGCKSGEGP